MSRLMGQETGQIIAEIAVYELRDILMDRRSEDDDILLGRLVRFRPRDNDHVLCRQRGIGGGKMATHDRGISMF